MAKEVFNLNFDGVSAFDGSTIGNKIKTNGTLAGDTDGVTLDIGDQTTFQVEGSKSLEKLNGFSVEFSAEFNLEQGSQTIIDSENPPLRLTVNPDGTLVGEINTDAGVQTVKSNEKVPQGVRTTVRFLRDTSGKLGLEVNDKPAGSAVSSGKLAPLGRSGLTIGAKITGKDSFQGKLSGLQIFDGPRTAEGITSTKHKFGIQVRDVFEKMDLDGRVVEDEGEVDHRFNNIKSIMHGAGVTDLSKLARLSINRRTRIMPGTILRAPVQVTDRPSSPDWACLLYTSPSPRDRQKSRMPSSA